MLAGSAIELSDAPWHGLPLTPFPLRRSLQLLQYLIIDEAGERINPLSAPRRTRALAALCENLTATETTYPGTDLTLVYTVKQP